MKDLGEVIVPQCLMETESESTELHIFTDASGEAYGPVRGYVRHHYLNGSSEGALKTYSTQLTIKEGGEEEEAHMRSAVQGLPQ